MKLTVLSFAAAAMSLAAGAAQAQATWDLVNVGSTSGDCTVSGSSYGNSMSCVRNGGGASLTGYAFSTQNGAGTTREQTISASQYSSANLSIQGTSGFGVANRTEGIPAGSPDHAVDNNPTGTYDMVVLNFGVDTIINQIGVGWVSSSTYGADISLLRWTGSGAPTDTSASTPYDSSSTSALLRSGWELVSSLSGVKGDNSSPYGGNARNTFATEDHASSWWMISAFNTALNTTGSCYSDNHGNTISELSSTSSSKNCDNGDDAFKLNWLSTTTYTAPPPPPPPPGVSAPGTLALAGLGLLGAGVLRRRRG